MCGILVEINGVTTEEYFLDALNLQKHRGPDDFGYLEKNNIKFGHRRLSVIDLEHASSQPMQSSCGDVSIVFNGEIYNFQKLKIDMLAKGYEFITKGDTEVLIYLYKEYGICFLSKLIGMFSFVLSDLQKKVTYVVRDRLGVKPLFYFNSNERYVFSSEIKSILHLLDSKPKPNAIAISSYMSFRYPILNDTFYEDIFVVEPGCYLCIDKAGMNKVKYWDLAPNVSKQLEDKGEEYYLAELIRLLKSSVKYRQIADVDVGAYLSGGVDSSAITALMSMNSVKPIPTFTIGFNEEDYNEFDYAKQVAEQYKTDHYEISLTGEDYLSTIETLIHHKDSPLGVPNEVPLYLMSKELKKIVTVVLSGEGADEIFAGYGRIFRSAFEYKKLVEVNKKKCKTIDEKMFLNKIEKKYGKTNFDNEVDHFYSIYSYTSEGLKRSLLKNTCHNDKYSRILKERFQSIFDELGEASYINKMMYAFEKVHLLGLLQRVDTTTMAASVEARVPFVDHRLVEFAFSIPVKYKLKWSDDCENEDNFLLSEEISEKLDTPKYILKKAMEPYLSNNILYRKKMGFPVPLNKWFGGKFKEYAVTRLNHENKLFSSFVNKAAAIKLCNDSNINNDQSLAIKVWMLLNLEIFYKNY